MTIISGNAYWVHLVEKNTKGTYPSNKYEVILGNLDADNIQKVKDLGMSKRLMNKENEMGTYIKIKNVNQPKIIDKDKNPIEPIPLIGNKSKLKVQVNTYSAGAAGLQMGMNTVMITDLVVYEPKNPLAEFDEASPFDIED